MIPFIIGALGLIAYGLSEENNKPKAVKKMANGGRLSASKKYNSISEYLGYAKKGDLVLVGRDEKDLEWIGDSHLSKFEKIGNDGEAIFKNFGKKGLVSFPEKYSVIVVNKKYQQGGGVGGEQITKVAEAIFSANEKNGKIKISTKASQTLSGLKYLIADLNSEHIASMIFEANEKNGKIKTQMGEKTYGQLLALISHAKANRLDNYNVMAKGGSVKSSLKEDDYVWNAVGKKLIVDKVTEDEYYLTSFMQKGSSPFSKKKVDEYIKKGQWTLKPKTKMAKGGRIGQSGYAIMEDGKLRTDAYKRVEFFATKEKALFTMAHIPFYKPLSKEEKLKLIVPYTIPKMAKGGKAEEKDLFEYYDEQPISLQKLFAKRKYEPIFNDEYFEDEVLEDLLKDTEKLGYTFEIGADNMPYNLRKK